MMRRGVIVGWWVVVVVGGSPCLFTPGWCGLWTVVSPYNLITSSVYVQTSFGAKSPRPSFYQIFWPLCLQISGANHHNRNQTSRQTEGTKLEMSNLSFRLKPNIFLLSSARSSLLNYFPSSPPNLLSNCGVRCSVWDHKCYKLISSWFIVIITVLNYMLSHQLSVPASASSGDTVMSGQDVRCHANL